MSLAQECPTGWREVPIGEVVRIDSQGIMPKEHSEQIFQYVGLENIESETGRIIGDLSTPGSEIGSRKYVFDERHVLYGRLRPYLNKTALPDFEGICSTDVLPLLLKPELVLRKYVAHYLRSPEFVAYADTRSSDTKMPRLGREQLRRATIPLPPLPIQCHIVDILERADELRRKRAQADDITERIPSALFVKMFGDPVTNPMGWPVAKLDEAANIIMGQSPPSSAYSTEGAGLPFFQGKAEFGRIYPTIERWCSEPKKVAEKGDILLSLRAPVGPVNLAPSKCCIGRGLAAIRGYEHRLAQKWLFHHIQIREQEIASMSSGTTFQAITSKDVRQLAIAFPPIELQQRFTEMANQLETQREQQAQSRQRFDALFNNLLSRAFQGELTAGLTLQEAFGLTERQMALLRILGGATQIQEPVLVTSAMKYAFLFQMEGTRAGQPVERIAAERRAPYITEPAYDFVPYKYGPFAKELYDDLEALEASGLVRAEHPQKDKGALREKTEIYLVQNQTDTIRDLVDSLPPKVRQAVDAVIGKYSELSQNQLLDMVYRRYPEYTVNNEWKRGTFTKAHE